MSRRIPGLLFAVWITVLAPRAEGAGSGQFWPELDAYLPLGDQTRLFLMGTGSLFSGDFQDATLGAHLDITLTPAFRKRLAGADWQRNRYLWMRVGYRYIRSLGDAERDDPFRERRGIFELTARTRPLAGDLEWIGRFRWDARDLDGERSDRYRVRVQAEKAYDWRGSAFIPYLNAEAFYDTRFDAWNRQRYQAGAEIEINRHWRIEPNLNYQTDSRSAPSSVKAIGLTLKYFH